MREGIVVKSTGSWYRVRESKGQIFDCRLRGRLKMSGWKATNPIAVGDKVFFTVDSDNIGFIHDIADRKNYIIRKATKASKQTHVIASNIDQAIIIATLAYPRTSTGFLDRFLVTCEAYSIPASIVFNKYDLILTPAETELLDELSGMYQKTGYPCMSVSATENINLDAFANLLKDKVSLLAGHSGVGKSALINAIQPGLDLKVQSVSKAHKKGRHTTTFAEMFNLTIGGYIIDTPGIKEFGLVDFEAWELCHYFPEMRKYFNQCHYDNCTHYNEPGCRVKEETAKGNIHIRRYENYLGILLGEDTRR
ncbi:MAG: ribosome small subunit-dependent GTPase A [Bacteroidia bacterium]|nr:MAG: ribosome small subunit-dependent GTPase A [Bacteroidia bacterium]